MSKTDLNPHQKPLLVFIKHILCWSRDGDLIIDATSGSGTLAVSTKILVNQIRTPTLQT